MAGDGEGAGMDREIINYLLDLVMDEKHRLERREAADRWEARVFGGGEIERETANMLNLLHRRNNRARLVLMDMLDRTPRVGA